MVRYYITHQEINLTCGTITVSMKSHTPEHLWLLYTTLPPTTHFRPDVQQPSTKPHHYNYNITVEGVVEQIEPSNTTQHTFQFSWPAASEFLWFYSINMGTSKIKATRSPIFVYQFTYNLFWSETWLPDLNTINGWQFNYIPGFNDMSTGLNSLTTVSRMLNPIGVVGGTAQHGNGGSALTERFPSCGMNLSFTIPSNDADGTFQAPYIYFRVRNPLISSVDVGLQFTTGTNTNRPFDTAPPVNNFVIHCQPGLNTFDINRLLVQRRLLYPTSCAPGNVELTQIEIAGGTHSNSVPYFHRYLWGPIQLASVNPTPIDVSKSWRALRFHPTLP